MDVILVIQGCWRPLIIRARPSAGKRPLGYRDILADDDVRMGNKVGEFARNLGRHFRGENPVLFY